MFYIFRWCKIWHLHIYNFYPLNKVIPLLLNDDFLYIFCSLLPSSLFCLVWVKPPCSIFHCHLYGMSFFIPLPLAYTYCWRLTYPQPVIQWKFFPIAQFVCCFWLETKHICIKSDYLQVRSYQFHLINHLLFCSLSVYSSFTFLFARLFY